LFELLSSSLSFFIICTCSNIIVNRIIPNDVSTDNGKGITKYTANPRERYAINHIVNVLSKKFESFLLSSPFSILFEPPLFLFEDEFDIIYVNLVNKSFVFLNNFGDW
jgi:hypothetical protein